MLADQSRHPTSAACVAIMEWAVPGTVIRDERSKKGSGIVRPSAFALSGRHRSWWQGGHRFWANSPHQWKIGQLSAL